MQLSSFLFGSNFIFLDKVIRGAALLQENGFYLLQENGARILL